MAWKRPWRFGVTNIYMKPSVFIRDIHGAKIVRE